MLGTRSQDVLLLRFGLKQALEWLAWSDVHRSFPNVREALIFDVLNYKAPERVGVFRAYED